MKFTEAKHFKRANRGPGQITGVTIHTMEYPERSNAAEWAAGFFRDPHSPKGPVVASAHYNVDNDSITHSVREKDIAYHAGPANGWSIGIEHAGRADQTPEQWADDYSVAMLERSAELVAGICARYSIPVVRLTADDLAAGKRHGIFGHVDVTRGLKSGTHWDPGPNFPWPWYLERVRDHLARLTEPPAEPSGGTTKAVASTEDEMNAHANFAEWVEVEGHLVCPFYFAPVGIGAADDLARKLGLELPTPALVDAIWQAADLRIDPAVVIAAAKGHDGTARTMNAPETHAKVTAAIERAVQAHGPYRLLAGSYKDVVLKDGRLGIYGWHRPSGIVVQPFFSGHARGWADYSQGLRFCRRL
jgi:hypothetical protein